MVEILAESGTNLFDSNVTNFITDAATDIIGLMSIQPLGTFLTIGVIGAVVGLVGAIVGMVRRR